MMKTNKKTVSESLTIGKLTVAAVFVAAAMFGGAAAEDWPMWGYDASRSGMSPLELSGTLHLHWSRELPEPRRAWPEQMDDGDKLEFDLSYSPVVMGNSIFVPSMVTDSLTAYDIDSGLELWRYYADGPVRLAPAAWDGKVFFVSDDGHLYCLEAASGKLLWKFDARASGHRVLGNERVISMWPARGGPAVKDGTVYFASGVWPFLGTFVYAVCAETGEPVWANTGHSTRWQRQPHGAAYSFAGLAPQGYIAVSEDRLVVSGGRALPGIFDRHDGTLLHSDVTGPKREGGYRVQIQDGHYYNHGLRYRLADGARDGSGEVQGWERFLLEGMVESLRDKLDSGVFEYFGARGRLFIVTRKGTLYCFGEEPRSPVIHQYRPESPGRRAGIRRTFFSGRRAEQILRETGVSDGYALFLGAGNGDLLEQVALRSELHIVAVEPDEEKIAALRERFAETGLYGTRVAIIPGNPAETHYPRYISSLVVMEDPEVIGRVPDARFLETVYKRLRPYGGKAFLMTTRGTGADFRSALAGFTPENGRAVFERGVVTLSREGALPGAGRWTHQYADSAQTVMSGDYRVRPPFGPVWFGGPNHDNILPRHAAGPRPQVAGGRLVILGVETISARCVFTGRELWVREFPGIGHPFTNLELEERWREGNQVYMTNQPGASYIGSPYVTLPDSVYVRYNGRVFRIDPAAGETLAEWNLPALPSDSDKPDWGHISVSGDTLITTTNPHVFRGGALGTWGDDSWDGTSSRRLVALDRHTGKVAWTRDAETGFRHNAIVSSGGRVFVSDLLSGQALAMALRRGMRVAERPVLRALDIHSGEEIWSIENDIFGTFLTYSAEHDILIEGGTRDGRRTLRDEPTQLMTARRGADGKMIWDRSGSYSGPVILHGDMIIPARPGSAVCLLTGGSRQREHPVTGEETDWSYWKTYGCGTANASPHLLLFRSGAAGFTDIEHDGGTGTLGGFRAGCTANIIAADGILNAPDYTRTCACNYQNQTSLGLIHMPEMELWTADREHRVEEPVIRLGVNLGAPGARRADNGTLWTPFPATLPHVLEHPILVKTSDSGVPVSVASAWTSYDRDVLNLPEYTVDGDPSTVWQARSDTRGRFRKWLHYMLTEPVMLDRVQAAWEGPEATQFRIETSMDGNRWETVAAEESRGRGRDMKTYSFDPVRTLHVRIYLGEHGDMSEDSRGRRRTHWARVYDVRIGDLQYPEAYDSLMPKDEFHKHSLLVDGSNGLNWVASSGIRGVRRFELLRVNGGNRPYTVVMHFSEPDGLGAGQRVFDVYLQGEKVLEGFDPSAKAGGPDRAITLEAGGVPIGGRLSVELKQSPLSGHPPVLSGVEVFQEM